MNSLYYGDNLNILHRMAAILALFSWIAKNASVLSQVIVYM